MNIQIRPAEENDYNEIILMYGDFVENPHRYANKDNDSFVKVLNEPNAHVDLAIVDEKVAGFVTYSLRKVVRYPNPILEVEELFVKVEFRRKELLSN